MAATLCFNYAQKWTEFCKNKNLKKTYTKMLNEKSKNFAVDTWAVYRLIQKCDAFSSSAKRRIQSTNWIHWTSWLNEFYLWLVSKHKHWIIRILFTRSKDTLCSFHWNWVKWWLEFIKNGFSVEEIQFWFANANEIETIQRYSEWMFFSVFEMIRLRVLAACSLDSIGN